MNCELRSHKTRRLLEFRRLRVFATVSTIRLELSNTLRRIFDHRVSEAPDGYRITPYDPAFEKQMQSAERIMKKRRKVLRVLAK